MIYFFVSFWRHGRVVLYSNSFADRTFQIFYHLILLHPQFLFSVVFFSFDITFRFFYNLFHQCCRSLNHPKKFEQTSLDLGWRP